MVTLKCGNEEANDETRSKISQIAKKLAMHVVSERKSFAPQRHLPLS